ncbi:FKBP-type peptidyl-prolyl cis-trans isomerase [Conchiformibius steedae DSM 2580]|uniref:Peptidyl-prolyl cis-trans isomerase n=1 Tax=Conchiformibius steedae DSM 2580 TaxID=1121352 RepID=A0AAE9HSI6_9NEIS|nr:FKBP-type peptidyl-prolyl cis-trans isomerase [Conchiformibius steedae]QMT32693.1 FKBP-type peptidyl-prolyl cis-trans isomerase [Conchiformibius steedae]URD67302.1 FKBP-type peptidyl-prolyl cis-trans isomerase [Conchiformibius steedae DSM 2580]
MKRHTLFPLAVLSACILAACNPPPAGNAASGTAAAASGASSSSASAPAGLESDAKQISYVLGSQFGKQLLEVKDSGGELDIKVLLEAVQDRFDGKEPKIKDEQVPEIMQKFVKNMEEATAKKAEENLEKGEKFLSENKDKAGVKTTESGLQYKIIKEGTGDSPVMGDGVMVEYTGKLIDGTEFDSTKQHGGEPFPVPLAKDNGLIAGWNEALQLMKEGGEYTIYIPAKLAYGKDSPTPKIPANSVLVFDMKIVKVEKGAAKAGAGSKAKDSKPAKADDKPAKGEDKAAAKEADQPAKESKEDAVKEDGDKKK